jgi:electron transfer flavoprotein alpha subunit
MSAQSVVVLVESDATGVTLTSQEALTFARRLGDRLGGLPLHAVAVGSLGSDASEVAERLGELGVAALHHAQDERLASYAAAAWAASVVEVAQAADARLVVAAGTPRGNEILAHVATRMDVPMAANVVDSVEAADGADAVDTGATLTVTRQVLGGSALEVMRLDGAVGVLSVAGHALDPEPAAQPRPVDVRSFAPSLGPADLTAQVVRTEASGQADATGALTGARVVVGAGRGAGGPDGFADLLELVELLGGALGVSRVVTSLGWRPHHEQVGQTGSRISPDLYVACGISGAIQHWAGCQGAKTILSINTDPDAPMMRQSNYAVVGDLHEIVPAVNAELRRRLG